MDACLSYILYYTILHNPHCNQMPHQLSHLTYGGVTEMDVHGQAYKEDDPDRVRPPQRGNDERRIGQGKNLFSNVCNAL